MVHTLVQNKCGRTTDSCTGMGMTWTTQIPREFGRDGNRFCGTPTGISKKFRNEDAFHCNVAIAEPPVTKKESVGNYFEPSSHDNVK